MPAACSTAWSRRARSSFTAPLLLLLELWSACSGIVRQRSRYELAALISAAQHDRPRLVTADVPQDLEGRYRLCVETFERLVGFPVVLVQKTPIRVR